MKEVRFDGDYNLIKSVLSAAFRTPYGRCSRLPGWWGADDVD